MVSVIVPIYNEEKVLLENAHCFKDLARQAELIFVDGGSRDRSIQLARKWGRVFSSKKGRAVQMNYGAKVARGDILLFLHADATISQDTLSSLESKIDSGEFVGGCLSQRIDRDGLVFRIIEGWGNLRARISRIFYGDQGIFVRRDIFLSLNGFPQVPIMEDVLFSRSLRSLGKTVVLPDRISVSARRWEREGIIRTVFLYAWLNFLFWLKVPLERINSFYEDLR